jgi:hypothetical protein
VDCGGYHREHRFIPCEDNVAKNTKIIRSACISLSPKGNSEKRIVARKKAQICPESMLEPTGGASLCSVSPQRMYRQQLIGLYLHGFLAVSHLASFKRKSWLIFLGQMTVLTTGLEMSLLAVATAAAGRTYQDPMLVRESLRSYIGGLNELRKDLSDPSLIYRDETLGACMNLSMYELFECPAGTIRAYLLHQEGCVKLVQLRGPRAHRKGLGHSLFLAFRFLEVSAILVILSV